MPNGDIMRGWICAH